MTDWLYLCGMQICGLVLVGGLIVYFLRKGVPIP